MSSLYDMGVLDLLAAGCRFELGKA